MNWKERKWPRTVGANLLIGAGVGAISGLLAFFASASIVTVKAVLEIGATDMPVYCDVAGCEGGSELSIEEPSELASVLRARYRTREAKLNRLKPPFLYRVDVAGGPRFIQLEVKADSADQGAQFVQQIFEWVSHRHERFMDRRISKIHEFLHVVQEVRTDLVVILELVEESGETKQEQPENMDLETGLTDNSRMANLVATAISPGNLIPGSYKETELVAVSASDSNTNINKFALFFVSGLIVGGVLAISLIGIYRFSQELRNGVFR